MRWLADERLTAVLFGLVVAMFIAMYGVFPQTLAAPLPGARVENPVLLFEFARTPTHLEYVFGEANDPERAARVAAMDAGNRLDFLFMPVYGFFVFSFFAAVFRRRGGRIWLVIGALGLVAAAADAVENTLLLRITATLDAPARALALLAWPVWIKFGLLALACGGAGLALWKAGRRILAAFCVPAPLAILPAIASPLQLGTLAAAAIGLGWLAMGLHAMRRSLSAASGRHPSRGSVR